MAMTPEDRRAVIGCVFASACILFAPGEFRAGGFLVFVTLVLAGWHIRLSRREALAKPAAPAPPPEPPLPTGPETETEDSPEGEKAGSQS
jgi:hypothetical protein